MNVMYSVIPNRSEAEAKNLSVAANSGFFVAEFILSKGGSSE